jgi:hypothetical protein
MAHHEMTHAQTAQAQNGPRHKWPKLKMAHSTKQPKAQNDQWHKMTNGTKRPKHNMTQGSKKQPKAQNDPP